MKHVIQKGIVTPSAGTTLIDLGVGPMVGKSNMMIFWIPTL
jgi:hypothetical protein